MTNMHEAVNQMKLAGVWGRAPHATVKLRLLKTELRGSRGRASAV